MALTYVCSPLSAPTRAEIMVNAQRARTYMTMCEREFGCRAVAPHAYLPYLLDDSNPEERALALSFGASLLALCDRLVIYGDRISSGMKEEIRRARELGIPILNRQTQLSDTASWKMLRLHHLRSGSRESPFLDGIAPIPLTGISICSWDLANGIWLARLSLRGILTT